MSLLAIVFVVLMLFWLFFGCYTTWDAARPQGIGTTIIPWVCVVILGYVVFSGGGAVLVPVAR